ncbi:protein DBF4 homolog A-like isoform X2 [Pristis pectinata]|uniref:protein DBF4 homolog A-like isoform X2 n=1 Tax=Pristis pectinata TaxID=685728 RepID=UPI00223CF1FA|nr:protein DBF4 homolog A-like isoform X2 [Pristis pectinata]
MKPRTNRLLSSPHGISGRSKGTLKVLQRGGNKAADIKVKPFTGKIFYLDLPSNKHTEKLEKDLQDLGGTIEKFLSKDINYIVSNRSEAKFAQTAGKNSPVPSPDSVQNTGNTSPHPSSRRESYEGSSHRTLEMISRGKSLVKKVIKEQEFVHGNSILSNAVAWGVRILYVDDIKAYIARKKEASINIKPESVVTEAKSNRTVQSNGHRTKAGRLKKPFIKVEAINRHYRPLYIQLDCYPEINYHSPTPCSPFDIDKKSKSIDKQNKGKARSKVYKMTCSERNCKMDTKVMDTLKEKKKKGYCECCMMKYEDLKIHLKSEHHRKFSESTEFNVVDKIISQFDCDFVEFQRDKVKRTKCNIGVHTQTFTKMNTTELLDEFQRPHKEHMEGNKSAVSWRVKNNERVSGWENKPSSLSFQLKEVVSSGTLNSPSQLLPLSTQSHISISDMGDKSTFGKSKFFRESKVNSENQTKSRTLHSTSLCQTQEGCSMISKLCTSEELHHFGRLPDKERSPSVAEESSHKHPFDEDMRGSRPQSDFIVCSDSDKNITKLQKSTKNNLQQKCKEHKNAQLVSEYYSVTDCGSPFIATAPIKNQSDPLQTQLIFDEDMNEDLRKGLMCEITSPDNAVVHKRTEVHSVRSSSPCMKLHRKVRFSGGYGRSKKVAQNHRIEISSLSKENCLADEDKPPSLPLKSLLELFQTSEGSGSEFPGFTEHSSQKISELERDLRDNDQSKNILSLFTNSSSLSSFLGF